MENGENVFGQCLIRGQVRVELVCLDEGVCGDYDAADPEDIPLLRFDVSYYHPAGECSPRLYDTYFLDEPDWVACADASYCTQLPVSLCPEQCQQALEFLMDFVREPVTCLEPIKKLCERLSWISTEALTTGVLR